MTKDIMVQMLYKALAEGVGKLIKNGLAFTVMALAIAGLIWAIVYLLEVHQSDRIEWKAEILEVKSEYAAELNQLRIELRECQNNNSLLLIQMAELKIQLAKR